jgi:hypothetical protein
MVRSNLSLVPDRDPKDSSIHASTRVEDVPNLSYSQEVASLPQNYAPGYPVLIPYLKAWRQRV